MGGAHGKRLMHIGQALFAWEFDLRRCGPHTLQGKGLHVRGGECRPSEQQRLVETSPAQATRVQGDGDDAIVRVGVHGCSVPQQCPKGTSQTGKTAVFEAAHRCCQRVVALLLGINEGRPSLPECRATADTATAGGRPSVACCERKAARGADRGLDQSKLVGTVGAKGQVARQGAAARAAKRRIQYFEDLLPPLLQHWGQATALRP